MLQYLILTIQRFPLKDLERWARFPQVLLLKEGLWGGDTEMTCELIRNSDAQALLHTL